MPWENVDMWIVGVCCAVLSENRTGEVGGQQPVPAVLKPYIKRNQVITRKYCYCWKLKELFSISKTDKLCSLHYFASYSLLQACSGIYIQYPDIHWYWITFEINAASFDFLHSWHYSNSMSINLLCFQVFCLSSALDPQISFFRLSVSLCVC